MPVSLDERRVQQREASRRYKARHPERVRANSRKQYRKDPQRRMDSHARWYQRTKDDPEHKEKALAAARRAYRPRREKQILALTGGRPRPKECDVCGRGGKICLDHCHLAGRFRGWLCHHCNLALGHVKDSPTLLRKLADYLEAGWST